MWEEGSCLMNFIWKCNLINTKESYSCFIFTTCFVLENISFKCVNVFKSPSTSNNFFNHDLSRKLVSTATEQVKMRPKLAHNDVEHKKCQNFSWHNMTPFKKSLFYIILECTRTLWKSRNIWFWKIKLKLNL